MRKLLLLLLLLPSIAQAQWICPPAQRDNPDSVFAEHFASKPAVGVTYYDSVYTTCFKRITDWSMRGRAPNAFNMVPTYSQLQAWNRNQSLIWLASEDLLRSPSYTFWKHLAMGGAKLIWDPANDSTIYYTQSIHNQTGKTWQHRDAFMKINVYTEVRDTVRVFPEYPGGLEADNAQEDLCEDGSKVVLEGYTNLKGFGGPPESSEVFVLYVTGTIHKGTVRSGNSTTGCTGLADMEISPSGRYVLLHWGSDNPTCGQDCGIAAYDTAMNYAGTVSQGHGHWDSTIDQNGREWVVAFSSNDACGPTGAHLVKYRIPNGYTLYTAQGSVENDTTITRLVVVSDAIGLGHVSGRALRSGFVVMSLEINAGASSHPVTHLVPFSQEIVKVYLDSKVSVPHLERLADHHSDPWYQARDVGTTGSGYWAQAHVTVSRDGTRVLWGSTWTPTVFDTIPSDSYVMDISNKGFNNTLVNLPANSWTQFVPASYKYDGTREVSDWFPKQPWARGIFAPEYGSIINFGGGGDGHDRCGNDIWMFNTATGIWRQATIGDTLATNYPGTTVLTGNTLTAVVYHRNPDAKGSGNLNCIVGGIYSHPLPQYLPVGSTSTGQPWSSHVTSQRAWDSYNRRFVFSGPNYLWPSSDNGIGQNGYLHARSSWYWDPMRATNASNGWTFIDSLHPDAQSLGSTMTFDPINKKVINITSQGWMNGGVNECPRRSYLDVTTYTWTELAGTGQVSKTYGDATYDRYNGRVLQYGCSLCSTHGNMLNAYDVGTNSYTLLSPDSSANGAPRHAATAQDYDAKDKAVFMCGHGGDSFEGKDGLWKYNVVTNAWTKMSPTGTNPLPVGDPSNGGQNRYNTFVYDPTNNVYFLIHYTAANNIQTIGSYQYSPVGEMWVYKPSAGDGRLFEPITGGSTPPAACSSPGL